MKKVLKLILICLVMAMCFSAVACDKNDESNNKTKAPGLQYKTYDGVLTVVGYVNKTIDGENVTALSASDFEEGVGAIKAGAFSGNSVLKEIEIPDSVKTIGAGAFAKMTALEKIDLPFVGESANAVDANRLFGFVFGASEFDGGVKTTQYFNSASSSIYYLPSTLKTVVISPAENYELSKYAFSNVKRVETVTINDFVTKIGEHAFDGAYDLKSFELSSSVTEIGEGAFIGCTGLKTFTFAEENGLKKINAKAFMDTALTEIDIPEGVEEIGSYCFASSIDSDLNVVNGGSKLKKVTLPNSLKKISSYAFYKNEKLEEVYFGNALEEIRTSAFEGCKVLKKVGEKGATLTEYQIDFTATATLTKICSHAFANIDGEFSVMVGSGVCEFSIEDTFYQTNYDIIG